MGREEELAVVRDFLAAVDRLAGGRITTSVAGGVHDRPPDPAFEASRLAVLEPAPNRSSEGVLNSIMRELHLAHDRFSDPQVLVVRAAVELAQCLDRCLGR